MAIKFGTDGWRAVIADDYTFENVRTCAQGVCDYLRHTGASSRGLLVGYDTRFASDRFADAVAEVATGNGVKTLLCSRAAPTPVVSYYLVHRQLGGAVIITASHNPPAWNGFKYKPDYGGSASQDIVDELERNVAKVEAGGEVRTSSLKKAGASGLLEYVDPEAPYIGQMKALVDLETVRRSGLKIASDPMFGSGAGYLPKLVSGGQTKLSQINGTRNPDFPGMSQPEPVAHNLKKLSSMVARGQFDVGIALDGDADRVGIVDEKGRSISTLQTFALLCLYLLDTRGDRGPLVRSLTMTTMIDKLAEAYGVPSFNTPVGFKYLGPVMRREDALAAGEESGGYAFRGHIPERDGILSGLFFLDMMVKTGKRPSELVDLLDSKVGPHFYDRWDVHFDSSERRKIQDRLSKAKPDSLAGSRVRETDARDGHRFVLEGGYWLLVRFSGTEPLLRIYAEAETPDRVRAMLEEGRNLAGV